MREEYKNILDEMVINKNVINESTNGRKLLMYLLLHKVLNYQDTEELYQMGPTKSIQHLMKIDLQSKNDIALIHFLNSLKEATYDDAYSWLKEKLDNLDLKILWKSDQIDNTLKTAWDNLKVHYKKRLEFVESYWRQFGVKGILKMDTFYNHNIVISNEKYKQIQKKIENFDDIFSTEYERIIVTAEAGYGKSTFVHEMARQWVKGDKVWTRKFEFLFLFRLAEVNENESKSLENLLTLCLCPHDACIVHNWLKDGNMSKVLFIFDGLDELRQNFCQEVNEIIFGGKVNLETVVITSRQCEKLTDIKNVMQPKLYIELKGYTDEGVILQLEKFSIPVFGMKNDLKNHLKIPLFNTIYCITHSESSLVCTNICSSIHSFVNFAMNRYRNSNQSFTVSCEEELLLTLGQAAQNKFSFITIRHNKKPSFIKNILSCIKYFQTSLPNEVEIPYPNVSSDHLFWAVNSGLLHNSSLTENLVFTHQTIAEFCAAYFWFKTSHLAIKGFNWRTVFLIEPRNAEIYYLEPFSQFVCYLHPEFKENLWRKFVDYVPIFDEYENLADRLYTGSDLHFSFHSVDDQVTIMNKLHFQENRQFLRLVKLQFEPEKLFKTIRNLKSLVLSDCTFNIGAKEFFIHFANIRSLVFDACKFYGLNIIYDDQGSDVSNPPHVPHLPLQKLDFIGRSGGIGTLLSFIMKYSTFLKSFTLNEFENKFYHLEISSGEEKHSINVSIGNDVDDCGIDWISELQNNKHLCISVESCELNFHLKHPYALFPIIETLERMQNLKRLKLVDLRKLTKLEANALADLLEVGLGSLKHVYLDIKMENQEDYEPILKNLSKLFAVTSLSLRNAPFTTNTLNYLADIFNKLQLEELELEYQEIFFDEQIINSINSCLSLKTINFCSTTLISYELFKKRIESKDRQLEIKGYLLYWVL